MIRYSLTAAAIAAVLAVPAYAQNANSNPGANYRQQQQMAPQGQMGPQGMRGTGPQGMRQQQRRQSSRQMPSQVQQQANQWRLSKLLGASVYGQNNKKVGQIDDIVLGRQGLVAVVQLQGGKQIPVAMQALQLNRQQNSTAIGNIVIRGANQQRLQQEPKYVFLGHASQTTGSGQQQNSNNK